MGMEYTFFPFKVDPFSEGGQIIMTELPSPESVSVPP